MAARRNVPFGVTLRTSAGLGPAPSERYCPGDVVGGKYRLIQKRGEGGMGSVWIALNTALDTQVAVKLIRGGVRYASAAQRLLREARATARVQHPAIVKVFDFGVTHRDDPFIVMELLSGRTLAEALYARRPLDAEEAVGLLLPVASGLMAAHARGVIHRDLKPDNIFIAEIDTGAVQPVVLDFGIVKLMGSAPGPRLTMCGPVGTPAYMSPEQVLELDLDLRTDVWTFSVVLYEALSRECLFHGGSHEDVMTAVLKKPLLPPAGVDRALWSILERGLSRDREARWSSFASLGEALARWLVGRGVLEDVTGASLCARWLGGSPVSGAACARRIPADAGARARDASSAPPVAGGGDAAMPPARDSQDDGARAGSQVSVPPVAGAPPPPPQAPAWGARAKRLALHASALMLAALLGFGAQGARRAATPRHARTALSRLSPAVIEAVGRALLATPRASMAGDLRPR